MECANNEDRLYTAYSCLLRVSARFAAFDQTVYNKFSRHVIIKQEISNKFCCQLSKSFCIKFMYYFLYFSNLMSFVFSVLVTKVFRNHT